MARLLKSMLDMNKRRNNISKLFNLTMFRVASENLYYDSSKAIRELGMRQEPHENSIKSAFDWYQQRNMLS